MRLSAEREGYDGLWVGETRNDPFLLSLLAAEATSSITVGTSIAIAFARTPMTLANLGYDLARYSRGRFVLGLGSQVKPHIERRFSMPWSHPAARMRELILAMRAIWDTWQNGVPLDFQGEFYTHTLMTPFFSPERHEWGPPPVFLAAVGERMTEVAAEVADGVFFHPFTHGAVHAGSDDAGAAQRTEQRRKDHGRFPDRRSGVCGRRSRRRRTGDGDSRHQGPDRLLRLDPCLPRRAGAARLGRAAARADPADEAGPVVGARRPDHATRCCTSSRWSARPPKPGEPCTSALRASPRA